MPLKITYIVFNHGLFGQSTRAWTKTMERKNRPFKDDRLYALEHSSERKLYAVVRIIGQDLGHDPDHYFAYCESLSDMYGTGDQRDGEFWLIAEGWENKEMKKHHLEGLT